LYEEQTRRGVSIKHWQEFEDVADHCTVCHNVPRPCPVKIDFGDVTMDYAQFVAQNGTEKFSPCVQLFNPWLVTTVNPQAINLATPSDPMRL
jgi:Fe-S oxidoreductase